MDVDERVTLEATDVTDEAKKGSAGGGAALRSMGAAGIVARVAGLLAVVGMLLPWLRIPVLDAVNSGASLIGQDIPSSFSVFQLGNMGLAEGVLNFVSSDRFSALHWVGFALWAVSLALLVIGLILSFVGKKKTIWLKAGAVACVVVAVVWIIWVGLLNQDISQQAGEMLGSAGTMVTGAIAIGLHVPANVPAQLVKLVELIGPGASIALGEAVASGVSVLAISYGPIVAGISGACTFIFAMFDRSNTQR